jgi:methionine-rich copper-binding protein CopC
MKTLATLVTAVVAAMFIAIPIPAAAHAALATSSPVDGTQLGRMPGAVSITLNEKVRTPAFLVLTDERDARVNSDQVQIGSDGKTVISEVPTDADPGDYSMSYRVVSEDGHPVTGTIRFTVDQPSSPSSAEPSQSPSVSPSAPTPEISRCRPRESTMEGIGRPF